MITKLTKDCDGIRQSPGFGERYEADIENLPPISLKAGTPIGFHDWLPGDMAGVKLSTGEWVAVPANAVDAHEPEESLPALAKKMSIPYDTLAVYARMGKILARKSGGVWLSTTRAIEAAGIKPRTKRALKRTCPRCKGTGKDPDNKEHRCYSCGGKGVVYIRR